MKTFLITMTLVAISSAGPPLSKSYLPPSVGTSSEGYSQGPQVGSPFNAGAPEVVAARSVNGHDHENHSNGFARNGALEHGANGRFRSNGEQGYDYNKSTFARNAVEDGISEPASYNFGYSVNDYHEGTDFGHHEERLEGKAHGQYHVVLPDGKRQTVNYEADEHGFKPRVSYQDSEDQSSGYDSNVANVRSVNGNHGNGFGRGNSGNGFGRGNHGNGFDHGIPAARSAGY